MSIIFRIYLQNIFVSPFKDIPEETDAVAHVSCFSSQSSHPFFPRKIPHRPSVSTWLSHAASSSGVCATMRSKFVRLTTTSSSLYLALQMRHTNGLSLFPRRQIGAWHFGHLRSIAVFLLSFTRSIAVILLLKALCFGWRHQTWTRKSRISIRGG